MRDYFRELDASVTQLFTPVVKWIVYICVVVFLLSIFIPGHLFFSFFGASAATTVLRLWLWQLVTYAFVHATFAHLLFNLLSVYFFGTRLEQRWGASTFIRFCVIVIAGSVATHLGAELLLVSLGASRDMLYGPIVGISGLVYGIMLVYAMYYPDDPVYIWGIFPIKVKYLVTIMGLLALMASYNPGGGIAHLTHLGGLLFGYLFIRFPVLFDWVKIPRLGRRRRGPQIRQGNRWRDF
jgi:membrane associated rhomboid family serine protease